MNQEVYNAATTLSQIDDDEDLWLGITNFRDNNVFEYESNSQAVISGLWESSQPNDRNTHHCVVVDEGNDECFFYKNCLFCTAFFVLLFSACIFKHFLIMFSI